MLDEMRYHESYIEQNTDSLWKKVMFRETYRAEFR
jgi:hypothetical protein